MRFLLLQSALAGFFLLQQSFHTAPRLICSTGSGILDPVAAVVAGLSALGCLPKLAPQTFRSVIQPTANELFRRSFSFFFQFALYCAFFFDFLDYLPPHFAFFDILCYTVLQRRER